MNCFWFSGLFGPLDKLDAGVRPRSILEDSLAKVLLHSVALNDPAASDWNKAAHKLFTESAKNDPFGAHSLTDDPADADLIIFTELHEHGLFAEAVRHHPYVKQYREKCFLFDPGDYALPFLPGLYASLRKKYHNPARTRAGYYLRVDENPYIEFRSLDSSSKYVGCFVGSLVNHPVRAALANLPAEHFLIEDTSKSTNASLVPFKRIFGTDEQGRQHFWSHYADAMAAGAFSLCPRGLGPGSIRLFESMRMGRCPVILSDEWVYPTRVEWPACSISVAEKDVGKLAEILEANLGRAAEMGLRARQEWERYYAPNVRFHWLVEDCLELLEARRIKEAIAGRLTWLHLLDMKNLRMYLTSKRQIYEKSKRLVL